MTVRLERAAMRFAVDPARQAADDQDTGGRELAFPFGIVSARRSRAATTRDRTGSDPSPGPA